MRFLQAKRLKGKTPDKMDRTPVSDKMDRRGTVQDKSAGTRSQVPTGDGIQFASEEAEALARETEIDLTGWTGSGRNGAMTVADVRQAIAEADERDV